MERSRPSTTVRRDDPGEFRVGRLKHERVKVPRGEAMMEWAESVMQVHADRKSVLEVRGRLSSKSAFRPQVLRLNSDFFVYNIICDCCRSPV